MNDPYFEIIGKEWVYGELQGESMRKFIQKGVSGISVVYKSGDYSNNLMGENFEIENDGNLIRFIIDLSRNLRMRDKASNSYLDARTLFENSEDLKSIQIDEEKIITELHVAHKKVPAPEWEIRLVFERKEKIYKATPQARNNSAVFVIAENC